MFANFTRYVQISLTDWISIHAEKRRGGYFGAIPSHVYEFIPSLKPKNDLVFW